ncbi:helix-turn-helix domain-containing protein [Pedobacter ginsengisoli]|uniref:helix-turn-helix domain-containing protein n=1 Tax=Pedobacter ginsengisoli TaxID=363852 RepID=UPI0025507425|nr:helix-turn-helix transcriptional regulator [Pedobacter ginsengisoli]
MNTTGKNIRALRQKLNLSQTNVAEKLGISTPAYSKIETGLTDINLSRLKQISEFFKVHPISLISPEGENPESIYRENIGLLKTDIEQKHAEIIRLQGKLIELYSEVTGK